MNRISKFLEVYSSIPWTGISIIAAGLIVGVSSVALLQQGGSGQEDLIGMHGTYAADDAVCSTACTEGEGTVCGLDTGSNSYGGTCQPTGGECLNPNDPFNASCDLENEDSCNGECDGTRSPTTIECDCSQAPSNEIECSDGVDDDNDGLIDCQDTQDCGTEPACIQCNNTCDTIGSACNGEQNGATCMNVGNACVNPNTGVEYSNQACSTSPIDCSEICNGIIAPRLKCGGGGCGGGAEICDNNTDDDGDGLIDCQDTQNCGTEPACIDNTTTCNQTCNGSGSCDEGTGTCESNFTCNNPSFSLPSCSPDGPIDTAQECSDCGGSPSTISICVGGLSCNQVTDDYFCDYDQDGDPTDISNCTDTQSVCETGDGNAQGGSYTCQTIPGTDCLDDPSDGLSGLTFFCNDEEGDAQNTNGLVACEDSFDNNQNGLLDCEESSCSSNAGCQQTGCSTFTQNINQSGIIECGGSITVSRENNGTAFTMPSSGFIRYTSGSSATPLDQWSVITFQAGTTSVEIPYEGLESDSTYTIRTYFTNSAGGQCGGDAAGNTIYVFEINEFQQGEDLYNRVSQPATCGNSDGSIIISDLYDQSDLYDIQRTGPVDGTISGYEVSVSGDTFIIPNLLAGQYTVTINDRNEYPSCSATRTLNVGETGCAASCEQQPTLTLTDSSTCPNEITATLGGGNYEQGEVLYTLLDETGEIIITTGNASDQITFTDITTNGTYVIEYSYSEFTSNGATCEGSNLIIVNGCGTNPSSCPLLNVEVIADNETSCNLGGQVSIDYNLVGPYDPQNIAPLTTVFRINGTTVNQVYASALVSENSNTFNSVIPGTYTPQIELSHIDGSFCLYPLDPVTVQPAMCTSECFDINEVSFNPSISLTSPQQQNTCGDLFNITYEFNREIIPGGSTITLTRTSSNPVEDIDSIVTNNVQLPSTPYQSTNIGTGEYTATLSYTTGSNNTIVCPYSVGTLTLVSCEDSCPYDSDDMVITTTDSQCNGSTLEVGTIEASIPGSLGTWNIFEGTNTVAFSSNTDTVFGELLPGEYTITYDGNNDTCSLYSTTVTVGGPTSCGSSSCNTSDYFTVSSSINTQPTCEDPNGGSVQRTITPVGNTTTTPSFTVDSQSELPLVTDSNGAFTYTSENIAGGILLDGSVVTEIDGIQCNSISTGVTLTPPTGCPLTCDDLGTLEEIPNIDLHPPTDPDTTLENTFEGHEYMILHFGNPTCNVVNDGLEALYANALSQSDRCGYNFMFMGSRSVPSRQDMLDYFGNITDPDTREYIIENAYQFSFPNNGSYCDGSDTTPPNSGYDYCTNLYEGDSTHDEITLAVAHAFGVSPAHLDKPYAEYASSVYPNLFRGTAFMILDRQGNIRLEPYNEDVGDPDSFVANITNFCAAQCEDTIVDFPEYWNATCPQTLVCYPDNDLDGFPTNQPTSYSGVCSCPFQTVPEQIALASVQADNRGFDCNDNDHRLPDHGDLGCYEIDCENGIDDDGNGDIDADDAACAYLNEGGGGGGSPTEFYCDFDEDGQFPTTHTCELQNFGQCQQLCASGNCCRVQIGTGDNCEEVANTNQTDTDDDGIGNVCDDDDDNDGITDESDRCTDGSNCSVDSDNDGINNDIDPCPFSLGSSCTGDTDTDGINDTTDNCPIKPNSDQADFDGDTIGDVCDSDIDGDQILNTNDLCPALNNQNNADLDSDGIGDVCDSDIDGDQILNTTDLCPTFNSPNNTDLDNDGTGDICDSDIDGDQITNSSDLCPYDATNQCGNDRDSDGITNDLDNCPDIANPNQENNDLENEQAESGFGVYPGDVCDDDDDNDGILDTLDNCVFEANTSQTNTDNDLYGDICDLDDDNDGTVDTLDPCPLDATNACDNNQNNDDSDGIPSSIEDSGPNNGDGNNDGILDSEQSTVATLVNPENNAYITLAINSSQGANCSIQQVAITNENTLGVEDTTASYPLGLAAFTLDCGAVGSTATVSLIYDQFYSSDTWIFKKFMPSTMQYIDINTIVTYETLTLGGNSVTSATYQITDGGVYDTDGLANGIIVDPAGPSVETVTPRTRLFGGNGRSSSIGDQEILCPQGYEKIGKSCRKIKKQRVEPQETSTTPTLTIPDSPFAIESLTKITTRLQSNIQTINTACEGDPATGYQRITRMRDVSWEDRTRAPFKLSLYCVTSGYKKGFQDNALTGIGEAIKMISKVHALSQGNSIPDRVTSTGFTDAPINAWYAKYVAYANQQGLLTGITNEHRNRNQLKALTPISESQFELLLTNAGTQATDAADFLDQFTALLHGSADGVSRERAAQMITEAFPEVFADAELMVGNNIQVYRTILSELQQKSTTRQEAYLRGVIGKFKVSDTRYFAGLGIDIEIIVKVLEEGLE